MLLKDNECSSPKHSPFTNKCKRYTNQAYLRWQREMFQKRLWSGMQMPTRVLSFSPSAGKSNKKTFPVKFQEWPVNSRKKPLIGAPTTVLDMPYLEGNICHHVIDWSSKGYLASVFEGEVYLWHPDSKKPYVVTSTGGAVDKCLRWNTTGTHFAIALVDKRFAIYEFQNSNIKFGACPFICKITAIEWTKNNLLLLGCSTGRISLWNMELVVLKSRHFAHSGAIIQISFSSSGRYVATSGTEGHVRVWYWSEIKEHFEIIFCSPVRGVCWHPWKDLLAIGGGFGDGSLSIWNACNDKKVGYKLANANGIASVDCLTWNPLTGELVVSYWQQQEQTTTSLSEGKNCIAVLSNLNTEVDAIEWHTGRVLYLLWGEGGTKLVTAATDENLCMWDFFGNSRNVLKEFMGSKKGKIKNQTGITSLFGHSIR